MEEYHFITQGLKKVVRNSAVIQKLPEISEREGKGSKKRAEKGKKIRTEKIDIIENNNKGKKSIVEENNGISIKSNK